MNTEPLKDYLRAGKLYEAGNSDQAADLLARSIGLGEPTPFMKETVGQLVDMNEAMLTLIINEVKK